MVNARLHEAIEILSLLRMRVLHSDPTDTGLRSSFREITHHLESIRQQRPVPFNEFHQLAGWLAMFLDADSGIRIRQYDQLGETERAALIGHINARKLLLQQAENDIPVLGTIIGSCLTSLNVDVDSTLHLEKQAQRLSKALADHLQDDGTLRKAMQEFIEAMQQSLENISATLGESGEDMPDLAETQDILDTELPDDPKQAQALLQKARANILSASQKVGRAGKAISVALESQKARMQQMSENLNRAEFEAQHDPLTGLGNRRKLTEFFKALGDTQASLLIIDVDYFKRINDRFGHDAGDEVLVALAQILGSNVRVTDLLVRLGGEEFAAVLPDVGADHAFAIAETLRTAIESDTINTDKGEIRVTASIGLASRKQGEAISHWIGRCDKALYEAKGGGRNQTWVAKD